MAPKSKKSPKTRQRQPTRQDKLEEETLGDSWVVDESITDSDGSSNHDSEAGSITEPSPPPPTRRKQAKQSTPVHTGTAESAILARGSEPASEFQMPRLDHSGHTTDLRQRKSKPRKPAKRQRETRRQEDIQDAALDTAGEAFRYLGVTISYVLGVLGIALRTIQTPLAMFLGIYFLVGLMVVTVNLATQSVTSALSPICRIPGTSLLNLPFCQSDSVSKYGSEPPPPEFDRLMESQSKFEDILAGSTVGVTLPADMKRSEAAIRDLRTLVRYSSLKSRNELALEFDGFIETARMASADLQKFNSHTGRAADSIISTARWTMRTLDAVNEQDSQRGAIEAFISDTVLAPFQPRKLTPALVLDQYVGHTRKVEEEINRLLEEAQALLYILQNLEERLDIMHDISVRDGQIANVARDELLSHIWTLLGGNKSELRKYNSQLSLLQHVSKYRETAWAHVSTTVLKLQAMNAELEELRERVGSTELLQDRRDIPLSVHLEAIQLGVERLEIGRRTMKDAESDYYERAMHRAALELGAGPEKGKLLDA